MTYTNIKLIREKGSVELNVFMEKYLDNYVGSRMEVNHSGYLLIELGASKEIVKEFKMLHEVEG